MNHPTNTLKYALVIALTTLVFFSGAFVTAKGQEKTEVKPVTSRRTGSGRDPFTKYTPPRVIVKKSDLITAPSIEARINQYKAQKLAAMNARVSPPKPTTAFLLSEIQVVGISRSPRGYAAIVEASPIKLAYVIYPGERFYDGQLVAIEDNRLVFRRETVYSDGRRDRSVEMKSLRKPTVVEAFAATAASPSSNATVESEKKSAQKATADKP
ncbi:MAG: hypothetical protein ABR501_10190 [Pyrinomonadaceae bacterium]